MCIGRTTSTHSFILPLPGELDCSQPQNLKSKNVDDTPFGKCNSTLYKADTASPLTLKLTSVPGASTETSCANYTCTD